MSDMVTVKIYKDDLFNMLMERVMDWNKYDDYVYELFGEYYRSLIDNGCFDGAELDVRTIVDNDYINYTNAYETMEEFKRNYPNKTEEELSEYILAKLPSGEILVDATMR